MKKLCRLKMCAFPYTQSQLFTWKKDFLEMKLVALISGDTFLLRQIQKTEIAIAKILKTITQQCKGNEYLFEGWKLFIVICF